MRTLFFINTAGLYISLALVINQLTFRVSLVPFARETDPMSVRFHMYSDLVPLSTFAVLAGIALWRGLDLPRIVVTAIVAPPLTLGLLIYIVWWIGIY